MYLGQGRVKSLKLENTEQKLLFFKIRLLSLQRVNRCDAIAFISQVKTRFLYYRSKMVKSLKWEMFYETDRESC